MRQPTSGQVGAHALRLRSALHTHGRALRRRPAHRRARVRLPAGASWIALHAVRVGRGREPRPRRPPPCAAAPDRRGAGVGEGPPPRAGNSLGPGQDPVGAGVALWREMVRVVAGRGSTPPAPPRADRSRIQGRRGPEGAPAGGRRPPRRDRHRPGRQSEVTRPGPAPAAPALPGAAARWEGVPPTEGENQKDQPTQRPGCEHPKTPNRSSRRALVQDLRPDRGRGPRHRRDARPKGNTSGKPASPGHRGSGDGRDRPPARLHVRPVRLRAHRCRPALPVVEHLLGMRPQRRRLTAHLRDVRALRRTLRPQRQRRNQPGPLEPP